MQTVLISSANVGIRPASSVHVAAEVSASTSDIILGHMTSIPSVSGPRFLGHFGSRCNMMMETKGEP